MKQPQRLLLAHSGWDAIPVVLGIAHAAAVVGLLAAFEALPWWGMLPLALLYAVSISWNVNSIAHNQVHNPYFAWPALNRAFNIVLSLACGFSQTEHHHTHLRHHSGNSDRPGADGATIDPFSIYRFGHGGQPEPMLSYIILSNYRDSPTGNTGKLTGRQRRDLWWMRIEFACVIAFVALLAWLDWRFVLFMVPFWVLGHMLSALNGYYEHLGGNPDQPMAWGVSSYARLYNLLWMNNGYHAEHHYRPKVHWTRMKALHREIAAQQQAAGVRVLRHAHGLGFLDAGHPPHIWPWRRRAAVAG